VTSQGSSEKRVQIIRAAQRRFAHYGLSKVTMDEIAADLGMGKASLYYYFPTKENLFRAVLISEQDQFVARVKVILEQSGDSSERLQGYVRLRFQLFRDLTNLNMLSYLSMTEMRPVFGDLFADFGNRELKLLQHIIREGKRSGEFGMGSPDRYARLFLHMLQGLRLRTIRESHDRLSDEHYADLEQELMLCTAVFLRGIRKSGL